MQDAAINSTNTDAYGDGVAGGDAQRLHGAQQHRALRVRRRGQRRAGRRRNADAQATGAGSGLLNSYTNAGGDGARRGSAASRSSASRSTLRPRSAPALTAAAWNGSTGGVLAIDVSGRARPRRRHGRASTGAGSAAAARASSPATRGGANTDYVQARAKNFDGAKGEGIAGTPRWIYDAATAPSSTPAPTTRTRARASRQHGPRRARQRRRRRHRRQPGRQRPELRRRRRRQRRRRAARAASPGTAASTSAASAARASRPRWPQLVARRRRRRRHAQQQHAAPSRAARAGGGIVMIRAGTVAAPARSRPTARPARCRLQRRRRRRRRGRQRRSFTALNGNLGGLTVAARGGAGANAWPTSGPGTGCEHPPGGNCNYHGPGGGGSGGVILLSSAADELRRGRRRERHDDHGRNAFGATAGGAGTISTGSRRPSIPGSAREPSACRRPTPTFTATNTPTNTPTRPTPRP